MLQYFWYKDNGANQLAAIDAADVPVTIKGTYSTDLWHFPTILIGDPRRFIPALRLSLTANNESMNTATPTIGFSEDSPFYFLNHTTSNSIDTTCTLHSNHHETEVCGVQYEINDGIHLIKSLPITNTGFVSSGMPFKPARGAAASCRLAFRAEVAGLIQDDMIITYWVDLTDDGGQYDGTEKREFRIPIRIETEDFSEILYTNLLNRGFDMPRSVYKALYSGNVVGDDVNNVLLNDKMRELLAEYLLMVDKRGSYASLEACLDWFGYGDHIELREVWENVLTKKLTDKPIKHISDPGTQAFQGNHCKTTNYVIRDKKNPNGVSVPWGPNFDYKEANLKLTMLKQFFKHLFLPIHINIDWSAWEMDMKSNMNLLYGGCEVCQEYINTSEKLDITVGGSDNPDVPCGSDDGDDIYKTGYLDELHVFTWSRDIPFNGVICAVESADTSQYLASEHMRFAASAYNGIGAIVPIRADLMPDSGYITVDGHRGDYIPNRVVDFNLLFTEPGKHKVSLNLIKDNKTYIKNIIIDIEDNMSVELKYYKLEYDPLHTANPWSIDTLSDNRPMFLGMSVDTNPTTNPDGSLYWSDKSEITYATTIPATRPKEISSLFGPIQSAIYGETYVCPGEYNSRWIFPGDDNRPRLARRLTYGWAQGAIKQAFVGRESSILGLMFLQAFVSNNACKNRAEDRTFPIHPDTHATISIPSNNMWTISPCSTIQERPTYNVSFLEVSPGTWTESNNGLGGPMVPSLYCYDDANTTVINDPNHPDCGMHMFGAANINNAITTSSSDLTATRDEIFIPEYHKLVELGGKINRIPSCFPIVIIPVCHLSTPSGDHLFNFSNLHVQPTWDIKNISTGVSAGPNQPVLNPFIDGSRIYYGMYDVTFRWQWGNEEKEISERAPLMIVPDPKA